MMHRCQSINLNYTENYGKGNSDQINRAETEVLEFGSGNRVVSAGSGPETRFGAHILYGVSSNTISNVIMYSRSAMRENG